VFNYTHKLLPKLQRHNTKPAQQASLQPVSHTDPRRRKNDLLSPAHKTKSTPPNQTTTISYLIPASIQIQTQPAPPQLLNQQPTRHTSFSSTPRTQIEAMPPFPLTSLPANLRPSLLSITLQSKAVLDASVRHPVFFTDRLVKAPPGVNAGSAPWGSPVSAGYVFEEGLRREGGSRL
jgi:hypothetical protein